MHRILLGCTLIWVACGTAGGQGRTPDGFTDGLLGLDAAAGDQQSGAEVDGVDEVDIGCEPGTQECRGHPSRSVWTGRGRSWSRRARGGASTATASSARRAKRTAARSARRTGRTGSCWWSATASPDRTVATAAPAPTVRASTGRGAGTTTTSSCAVPPASCRDTRPAKAADVTRTRRTATPLISDRPNSPDKARDRSWGVRGRVGVRKGDVGQTAGSPYGRSAKRSGFRLSKRWS